MLQILRRAQAPAPWLLRRLPPQDWAPVIDQIVLDGRYTTLGIDALREGCRRLGVTQAGACEIAYTRRSIGSQAVAPDGALSWVKVAALRAADTLAAERSEPGLPRLEGLPRPTILNATRWLNADYDYRAVQFSVAPSPTVERSQWAGAAAFGVSGDWIAALANTLHHLGGTPCSQYCADQEQISRTIVRRFGDQAPHVVSEWRTAHGDLHWSNLTYPVLCLIDWESWGTAPRGYDAARLVAASCALPKFRRRLESAFASDLATSSGRVAQLLWCAQLLDLIDIRLLDPFYRAPLAALARRVLARD